VLYAGYMLTLQRARGVLASWPTLAVSSAAGVLPLLALAWLLGEAILPGDWRPVVALAFTSQLVGQGLLIYALPHFTPLIIGLTLLTQPALTALIGWLIYDERLSAGDWVGAILLAAALVLVRLPVRAGTAAQATV
jgi:drug/metabolite transporter (DMT)-like permease